MPPYVRRRSFTQRSLALGKRFSPQIVAIEHHQIESAGDRSIIHDATVKRVELCDAISVEQASTQVAPNNLSPAASAAAPKPTRPKAEGTDYWIA
jgi:hypothetical protein